MNTFDEMVAWICASHLYAPILWDHVMKILCIC